MNKTKKLMAGISSAALALAMAGCNNNSNSDWESSNGQSGDIPPMPENTNCSQWDWDEDDGVWECEDRSSSHFGHLFFAGMFFSNRAALYRHQPFINYKNSPDFKGTGGKNTTTRSGNSGFGRGSQSTGG